MESFSRQSVSIAEISVAKSTNAEKCTTGVFLKCLLFAWLAYHSGKLSSCKCRTKSTSYVLLVEHYTRRLMRKGTSRHFRANMRFLNVRVALDFKRTPSKTVLKNLDSPQSYDCFRNAKSAWVFNGSLELSMSLLLVPYIRPPSNLLLFLLLWPDARGERLSLPMHRGTFSTQTRTEKDSCWWRMADVPRKVTVTTRAIFPPPH